MLDPTVNRTASKAEDAKKAKALLDANPGMRVQEACDQTGVSVHTYYRHNPVGTKARKTRTKTKGVKVAHTIPTTPATLHVAPLATGQVCPPGYVSIMIPKSALARLLMGGE